MYNCKSEPAESHTDAQGNKVTLSFCMRGSKELWEKVGKITGDTNNAFNDNVEDDAEKLNRNYLSLYTSTNPMNPFYTELVLKSITTAVFPFFGIDCFSHRLTSSRPDKC